MHIDDAPSKIQDIPAFAVSLAVHFLILGILLLIPVAIDAAREDLSMETIFSKPDEQIDYDQELEVDTEVAENLNTVSGGIVSADFGAVATQTVTQVQVAESTVMTDPTVEAVLSDIALPGDELLGEDLGETEVTGEVGAIVSGYGPALSRITQELVRLMRQSKVLVVWLFDESESMKEDQDEIRQKLHKVYEELGIAQKADGELRRGEQPVLLTAIESYGKELHELTRNPTADLDRIEAAISAIRIDTTGRENMCQAIRDAIIKYRKTALRNQRRMAVIVVTDECGDDGRFLEEAVAEAKKNKSPVYVLGREAVFGYPYAQQRWVDPETGLVFWPRTRRGPETAFVECLQWDGLRSRHDSHSSGFGSYEQVRLARESGGVFFSLPWREERLAGEGANAKRRFDFLAMKEYQPLLLPRGQYAQERKASSFRDTLWKVIVNLNPNEDELLLPSFDDQLNIRRHHYAFKPDAFKKDAQKQVVKAGRAMKLVNEAIEKLEQVEPQRALEASQRWRANFDLAYAQLVCFRVRLFQFVLAMDNQVNDRPKVTDIKQPNEWNIHHSKQTITPDTAQFSRMKEAFGIRKTREEYLKLVADEQSRAHELLTMVTEEHSGTPWARRAEYEIRHGFGVAIRPNHRDPRYNRRQVKVPKL